jgi:hypothetical protein
VNELFVDEFGFFLTAEERARELAFLGAQDQGQLERRAGKWERMTSQWNKTKKGNFDKIKHRMRKGIHPKLRGTVWQLVCESGQKIEQNPASFQLWLAQGPGGIKDVIDRDLGRTFPTHCLFKEGNSIGQNHLKNILYAYAACDSEVGYCQGMGFVVGTLLTQMGEEEAFWCLHQMMNGKLNMRGLYVNGFPMLQQFFFQLNALIKKFLPAVGEHFQRQGVDPAFYATQWFMTVFAYHFPFRVTLRVWDAFLCEGWKIVFRVAIALLDWEKADLLAVGLEGLLPKLKHLCEGKDPEEVIQRALKVDLATKQLDKLKEDYEKTLKT